MLLVKKHILLYICIAVVTTFLGSLAVFYLPERFMFDALTISVDRYNEKGWLGSYPLTMMFYDVSYLNTLHFSLVAVIQIPILFYLIYKLKVPKYFEKLYLRNVIMWISLLMIAFFISFPSKEFFNFIFVYLLCLVLLAPYTLTKKIILSTLMLVAFGVVFRLYYLLIPFIAGMIHLVNLVKLKNRLSTTLFLGLSTAVFISLCYGLLKGEFMSESSRERLNKERLIQNNQNADTMILSPIDTDTFYGESIGIFYGFFTVNLPINALRFLSKPQVLAFVLWQLSLVLLLLYYYRNILSGPQKFQHQKWIFNILIAYFIVQGVFEPDLGSAVRHKIGILPLIWVAIYYDKGLIKKPTRIKKYVFKIAR
jgi:hypothetical protein